MALEKRGPYFYGDSQADIESELRRFSALNREATYFASAVCACGHRVFQLQIDEGEGAAVRVCYGCSLRHPMADSAQYLDEADLEECECPCGSQIFEVTAGVALYEESEDVRWIYIGCRCVRCGLTACYGDWKCEAGNFRELLQQV